MSRALESSLQDHYGTGTVLKLSKHENCCTTCRLLLPDCIICTAFFITSVSCEQVYYSYVQACCLPCFVCTLYKAALDLHVPERQVMKA